MSRLKVGDIVVLQEDELAFINAGAIGVVTKRYPGTSFEADWEDDYSKTLYSRISDGCNDWFSTEDKVIKIGEL